MKIKKVCDCGNIWYCDGSAENCNPNDKCDCIECFFKNHNINGRNIDNITNHCMAYSQKELIAELL